MLGVSRGDGRVSIPPIKKMLLKAAKLFLLMLFSLVPFVLVWGCLCLRRSWIVELFLLSVLMGYPFILNRRRETKIGWTHVLLSPLLSCFFAFTYNNWLHSERFPKMLLNKAAIEQERKLADLEREIDNWRKTRLAAP